MRTNNMKKTPFAALFLIAMFSILAVGAGQSHAAVNTLKASAVVREEYDDNIFLSQDDREEDWITRAMPTIGLTHRSEWWDLSLDNTFNLWYYARLNKIYYSDSANLISKMVVVKNFAYFELTDTYANVVLEPRRSSTEVNFNVNRSDLNTLNASPFIKYDLDPATFVKAGYTYRNLWYRSGNGTNRMAHIGYANLDHKLSPVMEASVGGEFVADRPEDHFIIVSNTENVGGEPVTTERVVNVGTFDNQVAAYATLIYSFSPTTKFDGMGGFRWVRFEDTKDVIIQPVRQVLAPHRPHKDKAIYNAGLVFGVTGPMRLEFRGSSEFLPSSDNGIFVRTWQRINFQYEFVSPASTIRAGVFHRVDDYAQVTRSRIVAMSFCEPRS